MTVFEFEEIKNDPKLLSIVLQILLMEVTNQFLTGNRQTPFMIIVDETWMLLDFAASFFAAFVRTVRKYGGSLVICVQNFMDLHKTVDHQTILENSTWTITGVTVIGRLVLDDYSQALYSTDPSDFNFLRQKTAQGISLDEAVEQLALKKKGKI